MLLRLCLNVRPVDGLQSYCGGGDMVRGYNATESMLNVSMFGEIATRNSLCGRNVSGLRVDRRDDQKPHDVPTGHDCPQP